MRAVRGGDGFSCPGPVDGGWRGRKGFPLIKASLEKHSRYRLVPEIATPLDWVAFWIGQLDTNRATMPIQCSVRWPCPLSPRPAHRGRPTPPQICGEKPERATLPNYLNSFAEAECSCSMRPRFATVEGRKELAEVATRSGTRLVIPEDQWAAAHISRSDRWKYIEIECAACEARVSVSTKGILQRETLTIQCDCHFDRLCRSLLKRDTERAENMAKRRRHTTDDGPWRAAERKATKQTRSEAEQEERKRKAAAKAAVSMQLAKAKADAKQARDAAKAAAKRAADAQREKARRVREETKAAAKAAAKVAAKATVQPAADAAPQRAADLDPSSPEASGDEED